MKRREKYMPDVAKILKDYDPATFDERQRKALRRAWAAGLLDRLTPEPTPRTPRPRANGGEGAAELDKGALDKGPVTPPEERPMKTRLEATPRRGRRRGSSCWGASGSCSRWDWLRWSCCSGG